jgi:predicted transcriptional regulator
MTVSDVSNRILRISGNWPRAGKTKSNVRVAPVTASLRKILPPRREKAYYRTMTKLFEQAVEAVRSLPAEMQDELGRMLLQLAGTDQPPYQLSAEEEASLAESLAQADRGEFATDEQVRAISAKHNL